MKKSIKDIKTLIEITNIIQNSYETIYDIAKISDKSEFIIDNRNELGTMKFKGLNELSKYEDVISKTNINPADYVTNDSFLEAIHKRTSLMADFEGIKKARLNSLAHGEISTSNQNSDNAIRMGYNSIIDFALKFNKLASKIMPNCKIETTKGLSAIYGSSKAVKHILELTPEFCKYQEKHGMKK